MLLLPHVISESDSVTDDLKSKLERILEVVLSVSVKSHEEYDGVTKDKFVFLLFIIMESAFHLHSSVDVVGLYNEELFVNGILPYCRYPCNIIALRLFDLYISTQCHNLQPSFVKDIIMSLVKNLSSPFAEVSYLIY